MKPSTTLRPPPARPSIVAWCWEPTQELITNAAATGTRRESLRMVASSGLGGGRLLLDMLRRRRRADRNALPALPGFAAEGGHGASGRSQEGRHGRRHRPAGLGVRAAAALVAVDAHAFQQGRPRLGHA